VHYGYNYTADPDQPDWFVKQWKAYYGTDKLHSDKPAGDKLEIGKDDLSKDELTAGLESRDEL
jgi:hypothetical protein